MYAKLTVSVLQINTIFDNLDIILYFIISLTVLRLDGSRRGRRTNARRLWAVSNYY